MVLLRIRDPDGDLSVHAGRGFLGEHAVDLHAAFLDHLLRLFAGARDLAAHELRVEALKPLTFFRHLCAFLLLSLLGLTLLDVFRVFLKTPASGV